MSMHDIDDEQRILVFIQQQISDLYSSWNAVRTERFWS